MKSVQRQPPCCSVAIAAWHNAVSDGTAQGLSMLRRSSRPLSWTLTLTLTTLALIPTLSLTAILP